ncbi:hypothetical protein LRS73_28750 [Methylobacterium currus]|uniref:hypothetical protein n=1 Tax=Methylobacterium currus TaxID=2051553 RepID=UPI001E2D4F6F|nr:hypothetical protein [Methylobacterium currus]UHC19524.1 hypothetical protein LRS73_28750 [Methylobacterium currus]
MTFDTAHAPADTNPRQATLALLDVPATVPADRDWRDPGGKISFRGAPIVDSKTASSRAAPY